MLNPHFHTLCLDGVFSRNSEGALDFHPLGSPSDEDVAEVLSATRAGVLALLGREGLLDEDEASFQFDDLSEESPSLAGIYPASVQGRVALGQRSGRRVLRIGSEPDSPWVVSRTPLQAHLGGFDLHAAVAVGAEERERTERLCCYVLRPPVVQERLELLDDGRVLSELKTPFWDGTTHIVFEPLELLEKLAAIIPRPRVNQLLYHGVLGPHAAWRSEVVAFGREEPAAEGRAGEVAQADGTGDGECDSDSDSDRRKIYTWAELMRRAFRIDVPECPWCHGRMKLIALIEEWRVIRKISEHLGLSTEIPSPRPARSPPPEWDEETYFVDL